MNKPRTGKLSPLLRRQLPHGSPLGGFSGCDFCNSDDFAGEVAGIRLCRKHMRRVDAIARDAKLSEYSGRSPLCLPIEFRPGVS